MWEQGDSQEGGGRVMGGGFGFSTVDPAARAIWAKSGDHGGHGLLAHMLDVAAVAEVVVQRESIATRSWAAAAFGLAPEVAPRWFGLVAGLHDFGKGIPGFQAKWAEGRGADEAVGLTFASAVALQASRHDLAGAALLHPALEGCCPGIGWGMAVSRVLGAHHGYFPRSQEIRSAKPMYEGPAWSKARAALLDAYLSVFAKTVVRVDDEVGLPALAWLAGLVSVADWIGSNPEWFSLGERDDLLSRHFAVAQELADRALDDIGWPKYRPLLDCAATADELIGRILGRSERVDARPLQLAADQLLASAKGPALMIVEAPMGEGKTELAFLAHLRLQAVNGHRGLYVALPTQATGNAMFERALTFLNAFANDIHLDIQLVHGGAMLDERVHRLRGVNTSESESIASSAWFSQRKRPLLSPYGVGTVDQALFGTLNVKHHFVRLWGLANRVVVLDEVHAYDAYTGGLIEALLRWLKAMNCSVVLMSATLPAERRATFLRAWGVDQTVEVAYPRLLVAEAGKVRGEHVGCRPLAPIAVAGVTEDLDTIAATAMEKLTAGGCGVIIANTVQRAQELYVALKDRLEATVDLLLFHARMPADERARRERLVLEKFGRGEKARRSSRALLIATQVVEQSLDIDFDFMISDLAPVDLLLQRAGRLHRHERGDRPDSHRSPCLVVAGFQRDRLPELKQTAWGFVYDPYVLYRTWMIAGQQSTWNLPADIDRLVQAVYERDPFEAQERDEYVKTLDQALGKHLAIIQTQRQQARHVAVDAEADFANAYSCKPRANEEGEGEGLQVVTRLGEASVAAVPILVGSEGWRLLPEEPPFDPQCEPSMALAHRIYNRQLRLSRRDIVNALIAQPVVPAFELQPLLRNLRPLLLVDGAAMFGNLRVRLDAELGMIYESSTTEGA